MKFITATREERIGFDFYCDVADRIEEGRKTKLWTQQDLASAAGLPLSRIAALEGVKVRVTLGDVEKIARALDVSQDWLTQAEPDAGGRECLYLVWNENFEKLKLYQKGTSAQGAFLEIYDRIQIRKTGFRWFEKRDRARVKLVGIPLEEADLAARFPKCRNGKDSPIEPDE